MQLLRRAAAQLPNRWQIALKRLHYARQIKHGRFVPPELEYEILHTLISPGDWVIDIGANVGHYTKRFSELAGPEGRVIAFEPVPTAFALLSANAQQFTYSNVSLINAAVSDKLEIAGMSVPNFSTGLPNYYEARLSEDGDAALSVLTLSIDSLRINQRVSLVKIDTEGHESFVLAGMRGLIKKYHPVLIVETESEEVIAGLTSSGYIAEKLQDSHNFILKPDV
jgi:FkbM family methyltransferase